MNNLSVFDVAFHFLLFRKDRCSCDICRRSRRFYQITEKLKPRDREWLRAVYIDMFNAEEELSMWRNSTTKAG